MCGCQAHRAAPKTQSGGRCPNVRRALEHPLLAPGRFLLEFYDALNYLRNRVAHNARYIAADLQTMLRDIPARERRAKLTCLGLPILELIQRSDVQASLLKASTPAQLQSLTLGTCRSMFPARRPLGTPSTRALENRRLLLRRRLPTAIRL